MYKNSETEKKIDELLARMTIAEKVGQLQQIGPSPVGGFEISEEDALAMYNAGKITAEAYESIINHTMIDKREDSIRKGKVGSFIGIDNAEAANHLQRIAVEESRLGIPLIMGMDVIHGHKTIFPIPLAQTCSFDEHTFEVSSSIAAREASEDGIRWTYAPMADICRDARWGRICEGFGEDTYLASKCAASAVKGYQGDDISCPDRLAAGHNDIHSGNGRNAENILQRLQHLRLKRLDHLLHITGGWSELTDQIQFNNKIFLPLHKRHSANGNSIEIRIQRLHQIRNGTSRNENGSVCSRKHNPPQGSVMGKHQPDQHTAKQKERQSQHTGHIPFMPWRRLRRGKP